MLTTPYTRCAGRAALSYNKNIVASSEQRYSFLSFLLRKAPLIFLDAIFSI